MSENPAHSGTKILIGEFSREQFHAGEAIIVFHAHSQIHERVPLFDDDFVGVRFRPHDTPNDRVSEVGVIHGSVERFRESGTEETLVPCNKVFLNHSTIPSVR